MNNLVYVFNQIKQSGDSGNHRLRAFERAELHSIIKLRLRLDCDRRWRDECVKTIAPLNQIKKMRQDLDYAVKGAIANPNSMARLDEAYTIFTDCLKMPFTLFSSKSEERIKALVPAINALRDQDARIACGEWIAVPWSNVLNGPLEAIRKPHVSVTDPGKIAYNESVQKILKNIQIVCRPGRYLSKFYSHFSDEIVRDLVHEFDAKLVKFNLEFIPNTDGDAWVEAYSHEVQASDSNATSCMHDESCVKVYAHSENDLTLIVLRTGEGSVVARAIGNVNKKTYVRAYTNRSYISSNTFIALLEGEGWKRNSLTLDGQKLRRIEHRNGFLCPYIDGNSSYVSDEGTHLLIGNEGMGACTTNGYVEFDTACCGMCGAYIDEDDLTTTCDGESVCPECLSYHFTCAIGRHGEAFFPDDEVIYCESDGQRYQSSWAESCDIYCCSLSSNYYSDCELVTLAGSGDLAYVEHRDVVALDEDSLHDDARYAVKDDTVTLPDGRVVFFEDEDYWLAEIAAEQAAKDAENATDGVTAESSENVIEKVAEGAENVIEKVAEV